MDVTVIIVTFNSAAFIRKCLDSIMNLCEMIDFEIIIVDNASLDNTVVLLKSEYPQIILIENKINVGFGRAINQDLKQIQSEFVFLLNPDTELLNNALGILYYFMTNNNHAASCGGSLLDSKLNPVISYGYFPSFLQVIFEEMRLRKLFNNYYMNKLYPGCKLNHADTFPFEVNYVSGANILFRRKVAENIGYFDEDFFMYGHLHSRAIHGLRCRAGREAE